MSLAVLADHMASKGRNGDSMLVHMTPDEVRGLHALAEAHGGGLTINPETGLPEANFLKRLLPTIIGAALAATGIGAPMAALMVGGFEAVRTGDLSKGIMAGLGAYGGAGIGSALSSAGAANLAGSEAALAAGQQAAASQAGLETVSMGVGEGFAQDAVRDAVAKQAAQNYAANLPVTDRLSAGLSGLTEKAGRDAFMQEIGGTKGALRNAYMAATPLFAAETAKAGMPQTTTQMGKITPYVTDEYGNLRPAGSYNVGEFPGFAAIRERYGAKGGLMGLAEGGVADSSEDAFSRGGMFDFTQRSEPVVRMNRGGLAAFANGGFTDEQVRDAIRSSLQQGFSAQDVLNKAATYNITQDQLNRATEVLGGLGYSGLTAPTLAYQAPTVLTDVQNQARQGAAFSPQTTALSFVSTKLLEGQDAASIANDANTVFGGRDIGGGVIKPFTEADVNSFITSNRLGAPTVAASAPTVTTNAADQLSRSTSTPVTAPAAPIFGPDALDPTQRAIPNAEQLAAQKSILSDPHAAALGVVRSGVAQGLSDQQIADLANRIYGKSFSAKNVADFMAANGITRPKPVVPPVVVPPVGGGVGSGYTPPGLFPGGVPGSVVFGEPAIDYTKAPTMGEVRTAYEQGGGATKMPVITDIKPTDRTYTQNQTFNLLKGYLQANPNALYSDVVAFARRNGIPDMQAKAAYNEFRFSGLTGGSSQAYDYLMGRGAYPVAPFVPAGGRISRSYAEMMGLPTTFTPKNLKQTTTDTTLPEGVPKDVPVIKNPKTGSNYSSFAAFYFDANPDVREAYETQVKGNMSADDYAKYHYETLAPAAGEKEKRKGYYPSILAAQAAKSAAEIPSGGATGGLAAALAGGGMSRMRLMGVEGAAKAGGHLGDYSDGGRLLRGPGDGVSDSIPATIANKRPARLADGEFVVPARIVSELGNGSTEAGARKLYAMMDRVQAARRKSIGKGKVAKNSRADKYLPA